MKILVALGLIVVVIVAVVAIASRQESEATDRSAAIVFQDFRFVPNSLTARVGVPLRVTLSNRGNERHDINFPALHMPGLQGVEAILEPGETRSVTLRFDTPGEHTFVCSLPGHAAAGMTGAVTVRP